MMGGTRTATGFTLMELLVVITIVALLAAMVMGAVRLVVDAAKSQRCRASLRQIGIGAHLYAEDHEYFPPAILWHSNGAGDMYWMGFLTPYLESNKTSDSESINQIRYHSVIYGCPMFTRIPGYPTSVGYGMTPTPNAPANETIDQADDQPVNAQGVVFRLLRPGDVNSPGRRPYVADSTNWSLPASPLNRHSGRQNTVFFDLHVGAMAYKDLSNAVRFGTLIDP